MKELIVASNNQGKIKEYKDILKPYGFNVVSQKEAGVNIEVDETGTTFEENSKLKAEAIYERTHKNVIADDSGLEIEALNNEPGIYSARYKGLETQEERTKCILDQLKDKDNRKAKFTCVICYIDEKGETKLFKGIWKGEIAKEESGTTGFGYDPIFISEDGNGKTTASLPASFKEKYSHRAKAVEKLIKYLEEKKV